VTTSQLIDALVAHYGSTQAVNAACAAVWQDGNHNRVMLKVDAMWILYNRIQKGQK
jgi:hypothetical protein